MNIVEAKRSLLGYEFYHYRISDVYAVHGETWVAAEVPGSKVGFTTHFRIDTWPHESIENIARRERATGNFSKYFQYVGRVSDFEGQVVDGFEVLGVFHYLKHKVDCVVVKNIDTKETFVFKCVQVARDDATQVAEFVPAPSTE